MEIRWPGGDTGNIGVSVCNGRTPPIARTGTHMLDNFRHGIAGKIGVYILFPLLIIGLAFFGIDGAIRQQGARYVAKVGSAEISPDEFQRAYQNRMRQMSQQFGGRTLTPQQAAMFGIDQQVLNELIGAAAIDQQVKEMGLRVSDRAIADAIKTEPSFFGADGKFSKPQFDAILRANGLTEQSFITMRRRDDAREQLTETIASAVSVPQAYIDLMHRNRAEERVVEYVTIDPAKVVKVAEPDDAELKKYLEANKRNFMTPAFRKASLLLLTRDSVKSKITITDEDVKAKYEDIKATFDTPEKRKLQQVAFPDKAAADKAYAELSKAKDFAEAAAKLGFKDKDIDLGVVTKSEMIDQKVATAAFALKKDEVSKPIEGQFSIVIVRATEVTPGVSKSFDDVKALVKDRLASERAGRELQTLHDSAESERLAGRSLKEIGEKMGLAFKAIDAVDRTGNGPDAKPIDGIPDVAKVMGAVFGAGQGVETDAIDLADGGYVWYDVTGITPEKDRPFDEVKAELKTAWLEADSLKQVADTAGKLTERLMKGEAFAAIATDAGAEIKKTGNFTRSVTPAGLTADIVRQVFGLPKGLASNSATVDNKSRVVFRIAEVVPAAAATKEEADRIKAELQRGMQADALNAYLQGLQNRYGSSVNNTVLQQTLGIERK
jgi:peptidyl-prolyl cis-trans isomerase D